MGFETLQVVIFEANRRVGAETSAGMVRCVLALRLRVFTGASWHSRPSREFRAGVKALEMGKGTCLGERSALETDV